METTSKKTNLDWAIEYHKLGWSIFPIREKTKIDPLLNWHSLQEQRLNEENIKELWNQNPSAGIALITGKCSGIVVLDIDAKDSRDPSEFDLPPTVSARSGGGGWHFLFKYPGRHIKSTNGQLFGKGVDIKGDGGCVVLAPSIHPNNNEYKWENSPHDIEISEMPSWLLEKILKNDQHILPSQYENGTSEGNRNSSAASMAGKILASLPVSVQETKGWESFKNWNEKNTPPLSVNELRTVWESIKKYHKDSDPSENKKSQSNVLLEIFKNREDITLFRDNVGDTYVSLNIRGHQEILPTKSKTLRKLLAFMLWEKQHKAASKDTINSVVSVLEGQAANEGLEYPLSNRFGLHGENLWYDLTDKAWRAVKINKSGWEIINEPPILFRRYSHSAEQKEPSKNGDARLILNYVNISDSKKQLLLLVFLVSCFIPDFPHPILVTFGSQGSAKSTLSKLLRMIIDPSAIEVASMPENQKELIQTLAHHAFIFFDNISYISDTTSDTLCKAVTGSGFPKRELYSDDEDVIYSFKRCIGINGINLVGTRPDLLERSLLIELERIPSHKRKQEKEIMEAFEKDRPLILGGVLDILVKALEIKPTIQVAALPRMADFAIWGCAIAEALGHTKEEFLSAYQQNIDTQTQTALNENVVASTLISFMDDEEHKGDWKGTPSKLHQQLKSHAIFIDINVYNKSWPQSASILARRLNELRPNLEAIGILFEITAGTERKIHIWKKPAKGESTKDDTDGII